MRVFILYFFLSGSFLWAGENRISSPEAVTITAERHWVDLSGEAGILRDASHELTIKEISGPEYRDAFVRSDFNPPIIPVTPDIVWLKVVLDNQSPDVERYFYVNFYLLEEVDFFVPDGKGGYAKLSGGRSIPYDRHLVPDRNIIVPVHLPEGVFSAYIRVAHHVDNYYIPVFLTDAFGLVQLESKDIARSSIYFAFALVLFILNVIVFFVIREYAYIHYALFTFCNAFLLLGLAGFPHIWFDRIGMPLGDWWFEAAAHFAAIFSLLFSVNFLHMKRRAPGLTRYIQVLIVLFFINGALSVVDVPIAEPLYFIMVMIGSFTQLGYALVWFRRDVFARYYFVAWGIHLTIVILYSLAVLNIVETHIRIPQIMMGNTCELTVLAFALGQKFIAILREKRNMELKVHEVMKREDSLKRLTHMDPLTETYNRRKFDESLERLLERTRTEEISCGLILLDIDFFKAINDQYGHDIGDHVLINFARTVKRCLRKSDIFCRFGGEEFAVLLEGISLYQLSRVAVKIRRTVANSRFLDDEKIVTVSAGITRCKKDDTVKSMIKRADKALYQAKHNGRNRVERVI